MQSKGNLFDLSKLSVAELRTLQDDIKQALTDREHEERNKAREEIMAIAQNAGLSLKELLAGSTRGTGKSAKGTRSGKVAVQYRHPSNSSQQWTGRGRQPAWVKDWVQSGKSLDELRV